MVMIARIAVAEHIRQATAEVGVDIAQIQSLLRESKVAPDGQSSTASKVAPGTFNAAQAIKRGPQEAA